MKPSSTERGTSRAPAFTPLTIPPPSITPRKTLNSVPAQQVGELGELEPEAQVGAVGAEAGDRLVVGDPPQRQLELGPAHRREDGGEHAAR